MNKNKNMLAKKNKCHFTFSLKLQTTRITTKKLHYFIPKSNFTAQ